jgi:hypothetical protein
LFWLNVVAGTLRVPSASLREGFDRLLAATAETGTALALAGFPRRELSLLRDLPASAYCETMQQLAEFADTLGPAQSIDPVSQ